MSSYSFITRRPAVPVVPVLLVIILATLAIGTTGSAAESDETTRAVRPTDERVAELTADLVDAKATIDSLQQRLATARQSALESQIQIDTQRATILAMSQTDVLSSGFEIDRTDSGFAAWTVGYELGGGTNLAAFEHIILPCESGGQPDPDMAVGPTDDWGRAQINRPTWKARFEELTDLEFEEHITDPVLNGYMAAVVEHEHSSGLNAWTCWRKR